jgi:hypothetical protein
MSTSMEPATGEGAASRSGVLPGMLLAARASLAGSGEHAISHACVAKPVDLALPLYSSSARYAYAIETPCSGCYGSR